MKNSIEYLDKIVKILEKPYFKEFELYGIDESYEMEYVLRKIYGFEIRIVGSGILDSSTNKRIYHEYRNGEWYKIEYDTNGNLIYVVDGDGSWVEYDTNGNIIYNERSDGYWVKREYDSDCNEIYYENSNGQIIDNEIYYENSNGQIIDNR